MTSYSEAIPPVNSWDILKSALYERDYPDIFILQYGVGNFVPLVLLLAPRLTLKRTVVATVLILFGVFMMRYNVVIGGQSFSLTFAGYMHYVLPIIPHDLETAQGRTCGRAVSPHLPVHPVLHLFEDTPDFWGPGAIRRRVRRRERVGSGRPIR